jgi:hypothetical protein
MTMPTDTVRGGPSYQADTTWRLPPLLRRALLLTPPFALPVLEVFHPQPDFNVQGLLDASTWFAWFHVIQLVLTGLVAPSAGLVGRRLAGAEGQRVHSGREAPRRPCRCCSLLLQFRRCHQAERSDTRQSLHRRPDHRLRTGPLFLDDAARSVARLLFRGP